MPALSRRAFFTLDFERPMVVERLLRVHRRAMACRVEVALTEDDAGHLAAATETLNEADRVEALLTVFRDSSELSGLNREAAAGAPEVIEEVLELLTLCEQLHAETNGAFDITSTPLSRCWGFLQRNGRIPPLDEIEAARARIGM